MPLKQSQFSLTNYALKNLLSLGGLNTRLSILIYHRVLPRPDSLFSGEDDIVSFDQQMSWLSNCFKIIPLQEAIKKMRQEKLLPRTACITFDDGYADNAEIALPILQKHGISATFFVSTGFLNGGRMWNDTIIELIRQASGPILDLSKMGLGQFEINTMQQREQTINTLINKLKYLPLKSRQLKVDEMCTYIPAVLPNDLMMTSEQVKILHNAGMEIGGHTVNHPILARMEDNMARAEIADGKEMLEDIIRSPVRAFAYPNGKPGQDYLLNHVQIVKELGFEAAVSTSHGASSNSSDLYQLPRFAPWDQDQIRFTLRMAQNMLKTIETV
jgi:peptidoglycan/xylan/chitin deacetylase (PgdA/CDA1 family)